MSCSRFCSLKEVAEGLLVLLFKRVVVVVEGFCWKRYCCCC